jgi:hypothetical protein
VLLAARGDTMDNYFLTVKAIEGRSAELASNKHPLGVF